MFILVFTVPMGIPILTAISTYLCPLMSRRITLPALPGNSSMKTVFLFLNAKVHYIAQMLGCSKGNIYFCIESVIYCTMKYGDLIKERRNVLGLTQQDLADYTELSLRIIKSVESEKGNPSLKTLEKIAGVLGLELIMRVKIINE